MAAEPCDRDSKHAFSARVYNVRSPTIDKGTTCLMPTTTTTTLTMEKRPSLADRLRHSVEKTDLLFLDLIASNSPYPPRPHYRGYALLSCIIDTGLLNRISILPCL